MSTQQYAFAAVAVALLGMGWFIGALNAMEGPHELSSTTSPVNVPANTRPVNPMSAESTAILATTTITVPEDGWITSFRQTFQGIPDQSLRYSWIYDVSKPDVFCPEVPRIVFVMSVEKVPLLEFPPGHGYFVRKGTQLEVVGGFGNFSDADYPAASMTAHLGFTPASRETLSDAFPLFLNAECRSIFTIPPHTPSFTKSLKNDFVIPFDGTITFMGSHAHKHVKSMLLTLNGNELWKTSAISLPDGTSFGNPVYIAPFNGVPVSEGDTLNLTETYANPTDKTIDAMASMYLHIIPRGAASPSVHGH